MKSYIGIDLENKNIKAVVIDSEYNIIYKKNIITKNYIKDIKQLFKDIKNSIPNYQVYNIGVTGDNRFTIGKFLGTKIIVNEIECIKKYAIRRKMEGNLLDIEEDHCKTINIQNNELIDYKIYKSSNIINNNFLNKVSTLLRINIKDVKIVKDNINFKNDSLPFLYDEIKKLSDNDVNKNKILSSLLKKMFKDLPPSNYLIGSLSTNKEILNYLNEEYDPYNYYATPLGAAFVAKESKSYKIVDLNIENNTLERKIKKCHKCSMECEIVSIYRNHELIDSFGNSCNKGNVSEFNFNVYS